MSPLPFKTAFGNIRLSDIADDFINRKKRQFDSKKILDGKGLKVDFSKVPKDKFYSDTTDYKIGDRYVLFPFRMPEVYVERVG